MQYTFRDLYYIFLYFNQILLLKKRQYVKMNIFQLTYSDWWKKLMNHMFGSFLNYCICTNFYCRVNHAGFGYGWGDLSIQVWGESDISSGYLISKKCCGPFGPTPISGGLDIDAPSLARGQFAWVEICRSKTDARRALCPSRQMPWMWWKNLELQLHDEVWFEIHSVVFPMANLEGSNQDIVRW